VHPTGEHDDVRLRVKHDARDVRVVRRAGALWRRLEVRLQREVARWDGRVGALCAREAVGGLAVGEDENDLRAR